MGNKPRLLVSTDETRSPFYFEALETAGAAPEGGYLPRWDLSYDGLVLGGGGDITPALFGEKPRGSNPPDEARDALEFPMVQAFLKAGKPILGICRGMQVLNVALGGGIIQDLPADLRPVHTGGSHFVSHPVRAAEGSLFARLYGPEFSVNSFHHQAVGTLGAGLVPQLWAAGGLVEGFVLPGAPLMGVQFHPERMTGRKFRPETVDGAPLLRHFVSLCP